MQIQNLILHTHYHLEMVVTLHAHTWILGELYAFWVAGWVLRPLFAWHKLFLASRDAILVRFI